MSVLAQGQFFRILAQAQFIVFEPIMSKLQCTLFRIQKAVESSTVEYIVHLGQTKVGMRQQC